MEKQFLGRMASSLKILKICIHDKQHYNLRLKLWKPADKTIKIFFETLPPTLNSYFNPDNLDKLNKFVLLKLN